MIAAPKLPPATDSIPQASLKMTDKTVGNSEILYIVIAKAISK